ncbi:MAG TPA: glycerol-3-phosphate acyltransferase, partial [Verrucomicrobiae bacterium]
MPIVSYILVALGAYLLGSIPFGYLVAKAKGVDIRKSGSGNIGATNAMRVLGKPAGIFVLLMDALKGYAAVVWLTPAIYNWMAAFYNWAGLPLHQPDDVGLHAIFGLPLRWAAASVSVHTQFMVLAGVCAVLGHNYTCWLKFKGGKG